MIRSCNFVYDHKMIELTKYIHENKGEMLSRIAELFSIHSSFLHSSEQLGSFFEADKTLTEWLKSGNEVYFITENGVIVGFFNIGYRGDNVAWIEDIFVDNPCRNRGIATQAISIAEEIIKANPEYNAICFDVVPRNEIALKLYHKLGYNSLSLITVRKELHENNRDRVENVLGLDFLV